MFVGGVVVLLLFAALIGPYFINWTSYRQDFEREASRILGQKVEVLGSAEARLLPFPSVTFNNVRVVNAKTGAPMMSVARFSMDAELAPFLRGEILIFDMRLDRPTATVRLSKDGRLDWALRNANDLSRSSIVLEKVEVRKGTLNLVDEQNGRSGQVENINAAISAQALTGPWNIEGTAALNGKTGAFSFNTGELQKDGRLRVRTRLLPDREPVSIEMEGDARFVDQKPRYSGTFTLQILDLAAIAGQEHHVDVKTKRQPAIARATGNFALDNTRLRIDQYRLEVGSTTDPYVATGEATVDTGSSPQFMLVAKGQQIDIDSLDTGGAAPPGSAGKKAKPKKLTPSERLAILRRIGDLIPIPPMKGRASIELPAVVAGDTTVSNVAIEAEPAGDGWKIDRFQAQFPGRTKVEAKGALELGDKFGFTGNLVVASNQPSGLSEWLRGKVDPRIRLLDEAGFSANVRLSDTLQRFDDLELAVGPATAHGSFERSAPAAGRGKVAVNLSGDTIDLDTVRALVGIFIDEKSVVSLADDDVSARLKAKRLSAFGADAHGVDADLTYRDGDLDIRKLDVADVAGAHLSLSGRVAQARTAPTGTLRGSIAAKAPGAAFRLAHSLIGGNAVFGVLEANAGLFSDTRLDVVAALGGGATGRALTATATGTTGGSALTVQLKREDALAPLSASPMTLEVTAQNESVNTLLGQMGLQPLPIDAPGPALLSTPFAGNPAEGGQVGFDLSTGDSDFSADGRLAFAGEGAPTGKLDLALKSQDLTPYLIMNGIGLPEMPASLVADAHGAATLTPEKITLKDLGGALGGNVFHGDLSVSRVKQPVVSGSLSLDEIDAGWFARLILGPGIRDADTGKWSTDDFAPAQNFGVGFDVAVTAATAGLGTHAAAHDLSGHMTLQNGQLALDGVKAKWLGGQLSGSLRIGNANGSGIVAAQVDLSGASLRDALAGTAIPAAGTFDFSTTAEGSGKSALAVANAMTGSGALSIKDLTISGFNTGGFPQILKAADKDGFDIAEGPVKRVAEKAISGGAFRPGSLSQAFTIAAGKLTAANIALADANAKVVGDAQVDLAPLTVNAGFTLAYDAGEEAVTGGSPAIGLHFTGPAGHPHRSITVGDLSNYLSLRAYEIQRRRVELLQAGVLEKQRLRREIELLDAEALQRRRQQAMDLEEQRRRAAAKAAWEAEKAAAAAEARQKAAEEAQRQAEEEARRKAEAQAAQQAAEEARRRAEAEAERKAEEAQRKADQTAPAATPPDAAVDPAPVQPAPPAGQGAGPSGPPATDGAGSSPPPQAAPGGGSSRSLDFKDLPGVTAPNFGN
ncbi:MAG: AsmA family protein [Pararhizobium sp.]